MTEQLLTAMEAVVRACDEAYQATGFVKVAKTSEERLLIESAITTARAQIEDDAKPVDEEFLRANDFLPNREDQPPIEFVRRIWDVDEEDSDGESPAMHVLASIADNSVSLEAYGPSGNTLCVTELGPKTRGDVRRLLAALGVEL